MKAIHIFALSFFVGTCFNTTTQAQAGSDFLTKEAPRDGVYDRYIYKEKLPLAYDFVHEKDVMWEKRVWREIDTRVKQNHHFVAPQSNLATVLLDAAKKGDITAYSVWNDNFTQPLTCKQVQEICAQTDTVYTFNPTTFQEEMQIVVNVLDVNDIKKYRVKEVWFFDEETSKMNVRILGIAPIMDVYDNAGNFLHAGPMFWLYYPELRPILAQTESFNELNDAMRMSWDDVFEARFFDSHIVKVSNVHDDRLQDKYSGIDILLAADKVKQEIFNFEHDLWEY